jgi:hypothetical protein
MQMENVSEYDVLCSVVDFHSNRAVAHASFLIASIFGLFTVLPLIEILVGKSPIAFVFLSIAYWLLWVFGLYSFGNFSYFASIAEVAKEKITAYQPIIESKIRSEAKNRQWKLLGRFFDLKRAGLLGKKKIPLILLLYVLVGLLPFLAVTCF